MDDVNFITRWQGQEGEALTKNISKLIISEGLGRNLEMIMGRTEQGLLDLRGINFSTFHNDLQLEGKIFQDIDFSFVSFGKVFLIKCQFIDVLFNGSNHQQWNERGCKFKSVDFQNVKFRNAAIGIDGSIYDKVSFRNSNFSEASFYRPQFVNCDFTNRRLKKVDFYASNFINCKFSGKLESVWFRRTYPIPSDEKLMGRAKPNLMQNIDFSDASLWDVVFTGGLDLSSVNLPNDGEHILIRHFDIVIKKILNEFEKIPVSEDEKKKVMALFKGYLVHATNQPMWILNRLDLERSFGKSLGKRLFEMIKIFDESVEL